MSLLTPPLVMATNAVGRAEHVSAILVVHGDLSFRFVVHDNTHDAT
jgi:hypothetical protein